MSKIIRSFQRHVGLNINSELNHSKLVRRSRRFFKLKKVSGNDKSLRRKIVMLALSSNQKNEISYKHWKRTNNNVDINHNGICGACGQHHLKKFVVFRSKLSNVSIAVGRNCARFIELDKLNET